MKVAKHEYEPGQHEMKNNWDDISEPAHLRM